MFAPKATRAVIGVTVSLHNKITLFASELFLGTLEFPCYHGLGRKELVSLADGGFLFGAKLGNYGLELGDGGFV